MYRVSSNTKDEPLSCGVISLGESSKAEVLTIAIFSSKLIPSSIMVDPSKGISLLKATPAVSQRKFFIIIGVSSLGVDESPSVSESSIRAQVTSYPVTAEL